jgi:hypothetical protein
MRYKKLSPAGSRCLRNTGGAERSKYCHGRLGPQWIQQYLATKRIERFT